MMNYSIIGLFLFVFLRLTISIEYDDDNDDEKDLPCKSPSIGMSLLIFPSTALYYYSSRKAIWFIEQHYLLRP